MKVLTPSEAIGPALTRTKQILFQPFRFGRSWKLAASTYVAIMGAAFLPVCSCILLAFPIVKDATVRYWLEPLIIVCGLLIDAFIFWFFAIGSRMQFVAFDITVRKEQFVAPSWRRYRPLRWQWMKIKLMVTTPLAVLAWLPFLLFGRWAINHPSVFAQPQDPFELFARLLLVYLVLVCGAGVIAIVSGVLTDFVLPSIALEHVSTHEAFRRMKTLVANQPGSFCGYLALKVVLAIGGFIVHYAVSMVAMFVFYIPMLFATFLWTLAGGKGAFDSHVLVFFAAGIFVLIYIVVMSYVQLFTIGMVTLFLRCYAAYYLGGRYPLLGDLLEPSGQQSWWNLQEERSLNPPPAAPDAI